MWVHQIGRSTLRAERTYTRQGFVAELATHLMGGLCVRSLCQSKAEFTFTLQRFLLEPAYIFSHRSNPVRTIFCVSQSGDHLCPAKGFFSTCCMSEQPCKDCAKAGRVFCSVRGRYRDFTSHPHKSARRKNERLMQNLGNSNTGFLKKKKKKKKRHGVKETCVWLELPSFRKQVTFC